MADDNTSAWQMGNRTLERINKVLAEMELARNVKNYPMWFDKIVSLYLEVLPFLAADKSTKKKEIDDMIKGIRRNVSLYNAKVSNITKLNIELLEIEGELRILLLKYNLLIPKSDDPRAAVFKK
jgi:hypothetical protein